MLIRRADLDRIASGEVTVAFRRWRRPTVKAGGTLRTAVGLLRIDAVDAVAESAVTDADARAAGASSRVALLQALGAHAEGVLYRIRLAPAGIVDPRDALRADTRMSDGDLAALRKRLTRMDATSPRGPWTEAALRAIATRPGTVSTAIAADLGFDRMWLKTQIRKLKALGLTESLEVGYRLSPRGATLMRAWS
jgi:hypothetical protein